MGRRSWKEKKGLHTGEGRSCVVVETLRHEVKCQHRSLAARLLQLCTLVLKEQCLEGERSGDSKATVRLVGHKVSDSLAAILKVDGSLFPGDERLTHRAKWPVFPLDRWHNNSYGRSKAARTTVIC